MHKILIYNLKQDWKIEIGKILLINIQLFINGWKKIFYLSAMNTWKFGSNMFHMHILDIWKKDKGKFIKKGYMKHNINDILVIEFHQSRYIPI